ncbi:MAG: HAMP domain-containing protein [Planctomycetes bacterium]|nr:HAMP domain-containing protein [Planctomycetota bacterium]
MTKRRLVWKLYWTYLIVILLCSLAIGGNAVFRVEPFYKPAKASELTRIARLIEQPVRAALMTVDVADITHPTDEETRRIVEVVEPLVDRLGEKAEARITVILCDGRVVGDSEKNPLDMELHKDRPEIQAAYGGQVGQQTRLSPTLRIDMLYVATPLKQDGDIVAVIRTSLPLTELADTMASLTHGIIIGVATVAAMTALLALVISYRISRPLGEMRQSAEFFAQGNFSHKLSTDQDTDEVSGLAEALNTMADQLDRRIRTVTRQQRELAAVLSSMTEGVLAVDGDQRIISINEAAAAMFSIVDASSVQGRKLSETIGDPELRDFAHRIWVWRESGETELAVGSGTGLKRLEVHGSVLRDADDQEIGVLLMLRDVTHLRHLEGVRRDFVANVSHELKTPITSIQGFVETLREGAIADRENADRFLGIIARQADRLSAIIDDLLSLSRLQQEGEKGEVEVGAVDFRDVIQAAVTLCQAKAAERQITVTVECPSPLRARVNSQLIEQALSNLLDNAVKYSEPGQSVAVRAAPSGDDLIIDVVDHGCGIPHEHQGRIFERFYRVDKARSRSLGGTGLGLAIVKHIAQAHGGRVSLVSTPGQGSTFTIHLPGACATE